MATSSSADSDSQEELPLDPDAPDNSIAFRAACEDGRLAEAQELWGLRPPVARRLALANARAGLMSASDVAVVEWLWSLRDFKTAESLMVSDLRSALNGASICGHVAIIQYLWGLTDQAGGFLELADIREGPIVFACCNGHQAMVEALWDLRRAGAGLTVDDLRIGNCLPYQMAYHHEATRRWLRDHGAAPETTSP